MKRLLFIVILTLISFNTYATRTLKVKTDTTCGIFKRKGINTYYATIPFTEITTTGHSFKGYAKLNCVGKACTLVYFLFEERTGTHSVLDPIHYTVTSFNKKTKMLKLVDDPGRVVRFITLNFKDGVYNTVSKKIDKKTNKSTIVGMGSGKCKVK